MKIKKIILSCLSIFSFVLTFSSCGIASPMESTEHSHKALIEYYYDEVNHWQECECGEKMNIDAHSEEGKCVCGYENTDNPPVHEHKALEGYKYDESNHWQECECGEKMNIDAHSEEGKCVCGYENTDNPPVHEHKALEGYKYDESNHWQECECGERINIESHSEEKCVCGYESVVNPPVHEHEALEGYKYDESNHWQECECGEMMNIETHSEEGKCVCGYENTDNPPVHEHKALEGYKYDESNHWQECECGEKMNIETHSEEGKCVCGYESVVNPPVHEHKMELQYDDMNHWYSCYECGETEGYEAHYGYEMTEDGRTICEVCKTIYGEPMIHEHKMELQYDDMNHWYSCYECGETEGFEAHYGYEMTEDGRTICEVCGCIYGEEMAEVYVTNINSTVTYIDSFMFKLKVDYSLSTTLENEETWLEIYKLGYSNKIPYNTEVEIYFDYYSEKIDEYLNINIRVCGYNNGLYMEAYGEDTIHLYYEMAKLNPVEVIEINCDPKMKYVEAKWDNSVYSENVNIEAEVCYYDYGDPTGYYFSNSGELTISMEMYEYREEPYYLAIRAVDYSSAMPNMSSWTFYSFSYYIEYEALPTPTNLTYSWDIKSQELILSWNTDAYKQYEYLEFYAEFGGTTQTYWYTPNDEFYGFSFDTSNLSTGMYTLSIKALGNQEFFVKDSEYSYIDIYVEEAPVPITLPQVNNIQVKVLTCLPGVPSVLAYQITWDDVYTDLPIEKIELVIDDTVGSISRREVYNGEIIRIAKKYISSSGVSGMYIEGKYDCKLVLHGDDFYSLDSETEFSFYALYDTNKMLEQASPLASMQLDVKGDSLVVELTEEEISSYKADGYYIEVFNSNDEVVSKVWTYDLTYIIDISELVAGEYYVEVIAVGSYTYDGETALGYLSSNPITSEFVVQ